MQKPKKLTGVVAAAAFVLLIVLLLRKHCAHYAVVVIPTKSGVKVEVNPLFFNLGKLLCSESYLDSLRNSDDSYNVEAHLSKRQTGDVSAALLARISEKHQ